MINLITKADLYSYEAKFTFNEKGDTGLKTLIGGILSLFSIITVVIFSLYFMIRLFLRQDATIIYSSIRDDSIEISYSYLLPFMLRLSDSYSIPLESKHLFNISLYIWYTNTSKYNKNEIVQYYDILYLEKCNIYQHFNNYSQYFKKMNDINTYFCPINRLSNQSLYGIYGNNEPFLYYNFYFSKCINSTLNNNSCKSDIEIEKILQNAYLDIRYIDYSIDNLNKKKVEEIHIRNERLGISISVFKRIWLYLKTISYITDNGLFYNSYSSEIFHQYDSIRIDSDLRDFSYNIINGTFATLTIGNSGVVDIYKKSFLKFQDYLATIGGITKAISFSCYLLNYFNSRNSYHKKIIKDFIIEHQVDEKKNVSKNNINSTSRINFLLNGQEIKNSKSLNNNYFKKHFKRQTSLFNNKNNIDHHLKVENNEYYNKSDNDNKENSQKNNLRMNSFTLIPYKLKQKEKFEKKYSISFLPIQLTKKHIKNEFNNYIKMINKRLNIIYVLTVLEHFKNLDKNNNNNSNLNSSLYSIEFHTDSNNNKDKKVI